MRAVAPAAVEVAHERRAVVRREDRVHPADLDVACRVAGVLGELARARSPGRSSGTCPAGSGPARRRRRRRRRGSSRSASGSPRNSSPTSWRIVVGVVLDERQALLAEDLERRERAGQERDVLGVRGERGAPGGPRVHRSGGGGSRPSVVLPACRPPTARRRRRSVRALGGALARRARRARAARPRWPGSGTARSCAGTPCLHEVLLEARLDRGLDLLDPPDDALDLGPRARADSRAMSAPVPAALPAARTWARSQSGMSPRTIAWSGSIWLPNAPARRISSTASIPSWSISSRTPAYRAALASWMARTSFWVMAIRGPPSSPSWRT